MKYAITGHTKNIGLCLFRRLSPHAIGFSRSNGFDISNPQDRQRIVEKSLDCDVFVNNAHSGYAQITLMLMLAEQWANDPTKLIINVGSRGSEITFPKIWPLAEYQSHKLCLKHITEKLQPSVKCQLSYKWFGYVNTLEITNKYPHLDVNDLITVDQAADIILSDLFGVNPVFGQ